MANQANESIRQGENVQKMLSIQDNILGTKNLLQPSRYFVKEGELTKIMRLAGDIIPSINFPQCGRHFGSVLFSEIKYLHIFQTRHIKKVHTYMCYIYMPIRITHVKTCR